MKKGEEDSESQLRSALTPNPWLEATQAELESQFNFNRFLEIYSQIQVLYNTNGCIDVRTYYNPSTNAILKI